jgi:hypothetical protein
LRLRLKDPAKVDNRPITVDDTFVATFLDVCCESTPFEYDYVLEDDLADRYADFEQMHGCQGRYPLKDSLLRALGHRMVLIPLRVVMPAKGQGEFEVQLAEKGASEILSSMGKEGVSNIEMDEQSHWLTDIIVHLIVNVFIFVLLPIPLVAVAFLHQEEAQSLTLARDRFFTLGDVLLGPDPAASNWPTSHIALQNNILFYCALVFYGCLMIDFGFYLLEHFEILPNANYEVMSAFKAAEKTKNADNAEGDESYKGPVGWRIMFTFVGFRYIFHKLFGAMTTFACVATMGYIGLVAVWASLAAIINPTRFLAYTTGVLSSVTLVAGRYRSIVSLRNGLREQVIWSILFILMGSHASLTACQSNREGEATSS